MIAKKKKKTFFFLIKKKIKMCRQRVTVGVIVIIKKLLKGLDVTVKVK